MITSPGPLGVVQDESLYVKTVAAVLLMHTAFWRVTEQASGKEEYCVATGVPWHVSVEKVCARR